MISRLQIVAALLLCGCLLSCAQTTGQNVRTFQFLQATTISSGNINIATGPLPNIGQSSHVASVIISGGSWNANLVIQGSYDGNTWFNIGPLISAQSGSATQVVAYGYGAFPNVQVLGSVLRLSGTITATGYYVGNSAPAQVLTDATGKGSGITTATGSFSNQTGGSLSLSTQIAGLTPSLYAATINVSGSLTGLNLMCSSGTGVAGYSWGSGTIPTAIVMPASMRPYMVCDPGDYLEITTTGTGSVSANVTYRLE